jgi:hypothetical protein
MDPRFLDSALVGGDWPASRSGRFTSGELAPCTHWIGSWVGLRAGLDDTEKRPYGDSNSDPTAVQPVASRNNDNHNTIITCVTSSFHDE